MRLSQPFFIQTKKEWPKSIAFFPGVPNIYILFIRRIPVLADQYTAHRGENSERQKLLNYGGEGWLKEGEGSLLIFLYLQMAVRFPC